MSKLPEWPEPIYEYELDDKYVWISQNPITTYEIIKYERARADAALVRLHHVTEFLHHVISCSGKGEWPHDEAVATLEAIGPLPPLPKEAGR